MKKLLTVSLVAVMAVSAAHAKIASVEYVEGADVLGLTTGQTVAGELQAAVVPAIKALQGQVADLNGADGAVAGALKDAKDYADEKVNDLVTKGQVYTNTTAIASMNLKSQGKAGKFVSGVSQSAGNVSETLTEFAPEVTQNGVIAPTAAAVYSAVDGAKTAANTYTDNKVGDLGTKATVVAFVQGEVEKLGQTTNEQGGVIEQLGIDLNAEIDRAVAAEEAIVKIEDGKVTGGLISGMDLTKTGGQYVKYVEQADGKVTAEGADFAVALTDDETNAPQAKVVKSYTDNAIKELTDSDTMPDTCKAAGVRCALIAVGGKLEWEPVEY